tara:strand:- start:560 stop:1369 length:810 start_codon:yes stop_codon:yes gene_type:complete
MAVKSIGFYGFGKLAKTLYLGFKDFLITESISLLIHTRSNLTAPFDQLSLVSNKALLADCDVIILAVKPQQLAEVMPSLKQINWQDKCLVSLLAGVPLSHYSQSLDGLQHAFRIMPNTAAQFKQSTSTYAILATTAPSYQTCIQSLFSCIGLMENVTESQLDLCTALYGSGPAFFYKLLTSMIELAEQEGISRSQARLLINQLIQGLATSLNQRSEDLDLLINEICSPKGTTEAGLTLLSDQNLSQQWKNVFLKAKDRSIALSKEFKSV